MLSKILYPLKDIQLNVMRWGGGMFLNMKVCQYFFEDSSRFSVICSDYLKAMCYNYYYQKFHDLSGTVSERTFTAKPVTKYPLPAKYYFHEGCFATYIVHDIRLTTRLSTVLSRVRLIYYHYRSKFSHSCQIFDWKLF